MANYVTTMSVYFNPVIDNNVTVMRGTKGDDVFVPEGTDLYGPILQVGGSGTNFYNVGIPAPEQVQWAIDHDFYLGLMYTGVRAGFGWPSWATYGTSDTIVGVHTIGRSQAHGGDGTFTNLAGDNDGRNGLIDGDDFFYHGSDHEELRNARLMFSPFERDRVFMDNSDKDNPLDADGDGFRFINVKYKVLDDDTAQLTYAEVQAFSKSDSIGTTTLELVMTDPQHGVNFRATTFQDRDGDGNFREDALHKLESYTPGEAGHDLFI